MKKGWLISLCILATIMIAILTGIYIYKINHISEYQTKDNSKILAQTEVTDDCTEFADLYYAGKIDLEAINASVAEKTVSPNAKLIIETLYKTCGHTLKERKQVSESLVNLNEEQVKEEYPEYEIKSFSKDEIILYQEKDEFCNEHYLVKEKDGNIAIYQIDEQKNQSLKEETQINVNFLPDTDKEYLKNGIQVFGKENLNKILEDFE
ncbi:MAG: BofC C-terminal domain-containing protein [Clostridia bacterium]